MRFAYIDSQGNEVPIPSVDALALRIELGAIGPDTELYDAQADRWGPAHTHEIFHTLSRDVGGETFLVPSPTHPEEHAPEPPEGGGEGAAGPPVPESGPSVDPGGPPAPPDAASLGLTLSPPQPTGRAPESGPAEPRGDSGAPGASSGAGASPADSAGLGELVLDAPDDSASTGEAEGGAAAPPGDAPWALSGSGLENSGPGPEDEPPMFGSGFSDGGFDLEPTMDFTPPAEPAAPDRLDLEPPMSAFDPSGPPAWMEQDGPETAEGAMDFSRAIPEPDVGGPPAPMPPTPPAAAGRDPDRTAAPRRRGPPPRRRIRRRGQGGGWLLGTAVLALLVTGGYYAWETFGDRLRPVPPRPPVVLPAIPPELEGPARSLAEDALPAMFADIEARVLGTVPEEPSPDWLAGIYLGNASRFTEVEVFWNGIASFAEQLREQEVASFHAEYVALADSAGYGAEERALMVARADSGFMATREERLGSYGLLGRLADASLALHAFLVENEASIAYTPATAFSGNPVEEAVPATEELNDRMWDLVEDITNALDALGTLDRVTRERLSTVLYARIDAIGIR